MHLQCSYVWLWTRAAAFWNLANHYAVPSYPDCSLSYGLYFCASKYDKKAYCNWVLTHDFVFGFTVCLRFKRQNAKRCSSACCLGNPICTAFPCQVSQSCIWFGSWRGVAWLQTTREATLRWLALAVESNWELSKEMPRASEAAPRGFMLNLSAVLLKSCQPFLDPTSGKAWGKIDSR